MFEEPEDWGELDMDWSVWSEELSLDSGMIPAPNALPSFETRGVSLLFELVLLVRFVVELRCGIGDHSPREIPWPDERNGMVPSLTIQTGYVSKRFIDRHESRLRWARAVPGMKRRLIRCSKRLESTRGDIRGKPNLRKWL